MMSDKNNGALYIGVTGDLPRRVFEHQTKTIKGFTSRYHIVKLVYYETCGDPMGAIEREKQLKRWSRKKKETLIVKMNPKFEELVIYP